MRNQTCNTEDKSYLETLVSHDPDLWCKEVGPADFFLSHVQSERPRDVLRIYETLREKKWTNKRNNSQAPRGWVELVCLRQSCSDFEISEVVELIKFVGTTVVSVDYTRTYLERSFCLLEVYGTLVGKADPCCPRKS